MPFIKFRLLNYILRLRPVYNAVVPSLRGRPEPIHAIYSKTCLLHIQRLMNANYLKVYLFYGRVRVTYILKPDIARFYPELLSFLTLIPKLIWTKRRAIRTSRRADSLIIFGWH